MLHVYIIIRYIVYAVYEGNNIIRGTTCLSLRFHPVLFYVQTQHGGAVTTSVKKKKISVYGSGIISIVFILCTTHDMADCKEVKLDFTLKELTLSSQSEDVPGSSSTVALRSNKFVCVEYPAVVTNVDKMLETLGGEENLSKVGTNDRL